MAQKCGFTLIRKFLVKMHIFKPHACLKWHAQKPIFSAALKFAGHVLLNVQKAKSLKKKSSNFRVASKIFWQRPLKVGQWFTLIYLQGKSRNKVVTSGSQ